MFFACAAAGAFLTLWGVVCKNTGGFGSFIIVKVVPASLGIWCLFEVAKAMV